MTERNILTIVTPTKDRKEVFAIYFSHLAKAIEGFEVEIIIVNDSANKEFTLPVPCSKCKVLSNPKSGAASARNYGAKNATGEWLLFLDDDMLLSKGNLLTYLKHTNAKEKKCINLDWEYPPEVIEKIQKKAFGRFLIEHGFTSLRGWNNNKPWPANAIIHSEVVTSQNLLISKKLFDILGGYNENFPMAGYEDYDLSERVKKSEIMIQIDTSSKMFHNEIDRVEPAEWYKRKQRGGETRRVAVNQGYKEIEITYTGAKKLMYSLTPLIEPLLKFTVFFSSTFKFLDYLSFFCYRSLLGISLYKGYTKKNG